MAWSSDAVIQLSAVVVAVLTYAGSKSRELRLRRAELVRAYTNDFYADSDVTELFMDIDYDRLGDDALMGSKRELALIRLLDYLNAMGHNWKRGVLRLDDIFPTTLAYAVLRTWENEAVRAYLREIRTWDEERYAPGAGFRYFEELAIEVAFLCERLPREARTADLILSTPMQGATRLIVLTRFGVLRRCRRLLRRVTRAPVRSPVETAKE